MKNINVLFMGTPEIACAMLQRLIDDGYHIIGVVSQPDKKVGRKQIITQTPVKELALQHNIKVIQPISIKEDYDGILQLKPDLIVTCAYGQMIPEAVLNCPTYESINVHASLLPKLRGGAPIHKAIINGDKESGISIMRMVKQMDAGAVMSQCSVPIEEDDTMGSLYDKLAIAGAELLSIAIPKIIDGSAEFVDQDEHLVTIASNIRKEEEHIDFTAPLNDVYNHMRGLIPEPCSYGMIEGKKLKFHKIRKLSRTHTFQQGECVGLLEDGFAIAVDGGFILVDIIQLEGKNKTDAKAFCNGAGRNLVGRILH